MITKPKGTYDVLPNDSPAWNKLETTVRKICQIFNYKEIRTPIFESVTTIFKIICFFSNHIRCVICISMECL